MNAKKRVKKVGSNKETVPIDDLITLERILRATMFQSPPIKLEDGDLNISYLVGDLNTEMLVFSHSKENAQPIHVPVRKLYQWLLEMYK